jgi:thiol-disulfide isomerase/thioredoxin
MAKTMKLMKFGAVWCGACVAMKKSGALEKFAAAHPEVEVEDIIGDYDVYGEEIENEKAAKAEKFDVQALPTLIFTDLDENTVYAEDTGGMSLAMLEKLYAKAVKKYEAEKPMATVKAKPPTVRKGGR